jgi:hypothetical protein
MRFYNQKNRQAAMREALTFGSNSALFQKKRRAF